jgi:hypothetical protein
VKRGVQSSSVWTVFGWIDEDASFWPANLGARAIVPIVGDGSSNSVCLYFRNCSRVNDNDLSVFRTPMSNQQI